MNGKQEYQRPSVFDYSSSRSWLEAWYLWKKKQSSFSYQKFAEICGYKSRTFLQKIIKGERFVTHRAMDPLMQGLALPPEEEDYLRLLILFEQSAPGPKKDQLWERLQGRWHMAGIHRIEKGSDLVLLRHWYYPVVAELMKGQPKKYSPRQISRQVFPEITEAQVKEAVQDLTESKILVFEEHIQSWNMQDVHWVAPSELRSYAVRRYQRECAQAGIVALETLKPENRDISTVSLSLDAAGLDEARRVLQDCRHRLREISARSTEKEGSWLLNLQLFPVSNTSERKLKP